MRASRRLALVVAILVLVGAAAIFTSRRLGGLYWYDATRGYRYSFGPESVTRVPVALESDGLRWPAGAVPCGTAFLRLDLRSSWTGRWFEPSIAATGPAGSPFEQHFERGARGARFLNLSPLCSEGAAAGARVGLEGRHVAWETADTELLIFENPVLDEGSLLVLAPHPDDAEIAAFGLYRDRDAAVVTVTAGDYENRSYADLAPDPHALRQLVGRARTWDSIAVPTWGGVDPDRSLNLGYLTGTLEAMQAAPAVEAGSASGGSSAVRRYRSQNSSSLLRGGDVESTWESLVEDLGQLLLQLRPAWIAAPHPLLDVSADHRLSTLALLEALAQIGDRRATLMLYNNHHVHAEYYPYGPADSLVTLPPWFEERSPLEFGRAFSYRLSEEAVVDKLLALGMMHDLRESPQRELGAPTSRLLQRILRLGMDLVGDPYRSYSYFRRAARPNELFFLVDPDMREGLEAATRELMAR